MPGPRPDMPGSAADGLRSSLSQSQSFPGPEAHSIRSIAGDVAEADVDRDKDREGDGEHHHDDDC